MSQAVRTLCFGAVAVVSVVIAYATHNAYEPKDLASFSDVGAEFYPEFEDPTVATGLRVASWNEDAGKTETFSVENKNGLWRIPSHHDYPADGQDRLAKVAASMIGVPRQAMVERSPAAHKRYDLLDPLDTSLSGTEGRGDRITLMNGDETLVDFIVGKKVEGSENVYYVRRADEDRFYTADLGTFEVSTKFSDWINKDILDINRNDIRELVIDRYYVDEAKGAIVPEDRLLLDRESSTADWTMEGLAENEKVKSSDVNNMLFALNDLEIMGVRQKPEGISSGLKGEGGISVDPFAEADLADKGFFIYQGRFIANEGEVHVGTSDGIVYVLQFGEEFSGSDIDLEVGQDKSDTGDEKAEDEAVESATEESNEAKTDNPDADADAKPEESDKPIGEEGSEEQDVESDAKQTGRYLFVYTRFNPELLGEAPQEPVKPEKPADQSAAEKPAEGNDKADSDSAEESKEQDAKDETPAEESSEKKDDSDPQQEYEKALKDYELQLEVHNIKLQEYEDKMEKGRERSQELNERFADWYYVISEEVYDRLKLKRDELVELEEPKEPETTDPTAETATPELSTPETPEKPEMKKEPAESPKTPMPEKPAAEKSEGDNSESEKPEGKKSEPVKDEESKPEAAPDSPEKATKPAPEKPSDEKPSDEKPSDEKPSDEKPADEKPADEKPADEKPADEKPAEPEAGDE